MYNGSMSIIAKWRRLTGKGHMKWRLLLIAMAFFSAASLARIFIMPRQRFSVEVVICEGDDALDAWFETMPCHGNTMRHDAYFEPIAHGGDADYERLLALAESGKVLFLPFQPFMLVRKKTVSQKKTVKNGWGDMATSRVFSNANYNAHINDRLRVRMTSHTTTNCLLKLQSTWNCNYSGTNEFVKVVGGRLRNNFYVSVPYGKWVFVMTYVETPREIYPHVTGLRIQKVGLKP